MVAFASVVFQFTGWRFPLATTSARLLNPRLAIGVVICTEIAWFATNIYTVVVLKRCWKSPPGCMLQAEATIACVSFPIQVFLGHTAIRELIDFMDTVPDSW